MLFGTGTPADQTRLDVFQATGNVCSANVEQVAADNRTAPSSAAWCLSPERPSDRVSCSNTPR
ncbi:hypothetical protein ACIOD2_31295 [Amycolatopsis sp. NPDC088138]|uniref:hypothetical protein n=1 Tax=Amycolatopsis sp. NPDC088138 TaxID=3363938 RepID=UPI003809DBF9